MKDRGLNIGSYSILGDRDIQQDSFLCKWAGPILMAAVCDGMGGMAGGETASRLAVDTLSEMLNTMTPSSLEESTEWMRAAFRMADERIAGLTDEEGNRLYAGSTCVTVMVEEDRFHWGCVGDSRIYLISGAGIQVLTRMHNYQMKLDEQLYTGRISQEKYQSESSRGEALVSYLGIGELPIIDTTRETIILSEGDIILLCSDGLYKSLEDEQIAAVVEESGGNMNLAAKRLCLEAKRLSAKKQDNTTVIAIRCYGSRE